MQKHSEDRELRYLEFKAATEKSNREFQIRQTELDLKMQEAQQRRSEFEAIMQLKLHKLELQLKKL
jgi:hypothetical protein